jgi:hypothetical protein
MSRGRYGEKNLAGNEPPEDELDDADDDFEVVVFAGAEVEDGAAADRVDVVDAGEGAATLGAVWIFAKLSAAMDDEHEEIASAAAAAMAIMLLSVCRREIV